MLLRLLKRHLLILDQSVRLFPLYNGPYRSLIVVMPRSTTPLMTNLLPSAVGMDGRVNLFVGNVSSSASL